MSESEADSCLDQNGSQCISLKDIGSQSDLQSSQDSPQLFNAYSVQNINHSNIDDLSLMTSKESVESRASKLIELIRSGALDAKQQIINLITENDSLKIKLRDLKYNFNQLKDSSNADTNGEEADFCIDAVPTEFNNTTTETSRNDLGSAIDYHLIKGSGNVLSDNNPTKCDTDQENEKSSNCCFNCLGNHLISECKEPRDYKRINKNRRNFQARQPVSSARYHIEDGQKYGHIQPGQPPSKNLMRALGIKDERYLPPYVYQMRKLGYPPAWLRHAQINPSGLSLYMARDTRLEEFVSDVNNGEEGEISFVETTKKEVQYDVDKLIGWPGFNVEPIEDYKDESRFYRAPTLQLDRTNPNFQSLEAMKKRLSEHKQKGYVRGEMQNTNVGGNSHELSIAEGIDDGMQPPGQNPLPASDPSPIPHKAPKFTPASVKSSDHGTPIVDTYSPYNELPSSEKWTCYTTDHIFFENLPESTGKYDKMVDILKKCRQAKKDIENIAQDNSNSNNTTPSGS